MAERMLFSALAYFKVLLILLNSISLVYSKDCWIKRDKRDRILVPMNKTYCTPSNNPCSVFGGILELTESAKCMCVCPRMKSTYMETTDKCSSLSDVQSKCSFTFKGQTSIPVISKAIELNIPKKFRRCRIMEANRKKSFYLSGSVWKQLPETDEFPFTLEKKFVRGRIHSAYVKQETRYVPSMLNGKVFRLGISCRRRNDCVTFKVSGKTLDQCIIHPTSANPPSSSTLFPSYIPSISTTPSALPTRKHTIASEPSDTNKNSRASSSVKVPWSVIGAIIGILIALISCIVILAVCFWRKKAKSRMKQAGNASSQSSGVTLSSAESQPEVTYASPHHPYQELKPPLSGTPRGVYQPLNWTAREDASGYMLPSTATNLPDPLYNEIGSPRRPLPPVYDYALPENTVRISNHLSNIDLSGINGLPNAGARNESDYIGRVSKDQQEPKSPPLENAAPAPVNDEPPCTSPLYLDFSSECANQPESSECKGSDSGGKVASGLSTRYKNPRNGPKSTFEKSSPNERPYSVLESPTSPVNQPIKLATENLQDTSNKESKA